MAREIAQLTDGFDPMIKQRAEFQKANLIIAQHMTDKSMQGFMALETVREVTAAVSVSEYNENGRHRYEQSWATEFR